MGLCGKEEFWLTDIKNAFLCQAVELHSGRIQGNKRHGLWPSICRVSWEASGGVRVGGSLQELPGDPLKGSHIPVSYFEFPPIKQAQTEPLFSCCLTKGQGSQS